MTQNKDKINFHYIKSNNFRVVHADGVFGGLTPSGDIFASIFSQRPAIPNLTVNQIKENGELGPEIERVSKDGIIRELEVGLAMRPETAEQLIKWLQERVTEFRKLQEIQQKPSSDAKVQ